MPKCFAGILLLCACVSAQTGTVLHPDARYKADLLLVVAHPDDETVIGSYLARAVFEEHKRVAVVFGTRGNSGGNGNGQEQAAALGLIREIEARRALAVFGITEVWFLDAPDTPSQEVLNSLENWNHGRCLDQVVRIVRLTRPQVIATWLPDYVGGENHGDHQAASVLATEAFDIAGDPTQFPEQVAPPRSANGMGNLTEGLQTWQPQKLYYYTDASHLDFVKNQGPTYSASDISPSKHESYARLAAEECAPHLTQSDSGAVAAQALAHNEVDKTYLADPARLIFGKSYVPSSITGDLFEGVKPQIAYRPLTPAAAPESEPKLELWGSFLFYRNFWRAHNIEHLAKLVPPEVIGGAGEHVTIPLGIANTSKQAIDSRIEVSAPAGWKVQTGSGEFHIPPGGSWESQLTLVAPLQPDREWKPLTISAKNLGEVTVRVQVSSFAMPQ